MKFHTKTLEITPGPGFSLQNITRQVSDFVVETGVQEGQLTAFYKHTTGSIFIGEHESGIIADIERALEAIAPFNGTYLHHRRELDFNGSAHVRAAFMPTSVVIPIHEGSLVMGTHQEIMVTNGQSESLPRYIVLQVMGE
ncbi:MAG: YjbQ family protein [Leptolinea sp.]|jgi:secondary thiamine-phosphate synthase enzyme|nr:YjbQ family protein [Leptolinea sp.]